jgi:hypothetical protein
MIKAQPALRFLFAANDHHYHRACERLLKRFNIHGFVSP